MPGKAGGWSLIEDDRIVCPACRAALDRDGDRWACLGCGASYRGLRGIPDLRTADDAFLDNEADWAFALRLNDDFDRLDFRGLLDRYFDLAPDVPPDLRARQIGHILSAPDRARQWLDLLGPGLGDGPLLDLGCGSGSFLAAMGATGRELWGVDIAIRWLLIARKRLDEEGLGHVRLASACAERLPMAGSTFAGVVAGDVIEHVGDQAATLAEAHRVLRPGGRLVLAAPNRFSLAPEPHVGVWGVGFLPRRWMSPYVRLMRRGDFRAIRTLGIGEWRRLLARSPFGGGAIRAPGLPDGDLARFKPITRTLALAYNAAVATVPGQTLARAVGPLLHVACTRGEVDPAIRSASRATRRRSRRPARPG